MNELVTILWFVAGIMGYWLADRTAKAMGGFVYTRCIFLIVTGPFFLFLASILTICLTEE